jgi:hypothetical protein
MDIPCRPDRLGATLPGQRQRVSQFWDTERNPLDSSKPDVKLHALSEDPV